MTESEYEEAQYKAELAAKELQARMDSDRERFATLRGKAIAEFATLEHMLCALFSDFGNLQPTVATTIFFKIQNLHAIRNIMRELIEQKYGDRFAKFWGSLNSAVQRMSEMRNRIVHHSIMTASFPDGRMATAIFKPQDLYKQSGYEEALQDRNRTLNEVELGAFIQECHFVRRLCLFFYGYLTQDADLVVGPEELRGRVSPAIWDDIFAREISYPPDSTHPLFPLYKAREMA